MAIKTETLLKMLSNTEAMEQVTKATGLDAKDVSKVLDLVLPTLIKGAQGQATNKDTAAGFLEAITDHAAADDSDMGKFMKNVDVADGAKIVKHLLGAEEAKEAEKVNKKSGVDPKKVAKIMALVAPLIMTQLGKSAKKNGAKKPAAKKAPAKNGAKGLDAADVIEIVTDLKDGFGGEDVVNILGKLF